MIADIVIAGGGPNGLMLACELSLAGIRPLVLERLPERTQDNRANGLVGQVVRTLDRRGLYERLAGNQDPPRPAPGFVFGALPIDLSVLDDNPLYILQVPQRRIEQMLEERAVELAVEIRRGHELTGFTQDADGVTLQVSGPAGPYTIETRYLIGADGGHSIVRKLAGIAFPGVTTDETIARTAHAVVPAELVDPVTGGLDIPGYGPIPPFLHHRTEHGLFVYAPLPGAPAPLISTMEWNGQDAEGPLTLAELQASAHRVLGVNIAFGPPDGQGPHLMRKLNGGNTRLAERFRDGRVLLVGDAAHVHSAIGGPGLNLGLQDAVNLGWKLAAEARGTAPAGLLDTYESERRPAAERVVMSSRAQSALIAPGSEVTGLRALFTELLGDPRNVRRIADLMSGADVRYEVGGDHPLAGRWAPDLDLKDGARLAELTRDGRPHLIDFTGDDWGYPATAGLPGSAVPCTAMLLRPDGYVAWATDVPQPDAASRASLRAAIQRWLG
ncbi:2-polyprenyl-6-methoxyphenol hydroxylase [Streptosporangium subroseum]|uniref:2-polyprenyl-6-methoxyphenol hydroxylase n=1 Tax=Streptosporangium subroseum TaxID=106412 RepID=A0A239P6F7_9ACTN|nr:FAD-dependent monooxygenase [Streptosporangium subroseum]SNT62208.1 2-polyprenyl-6-methoxyphenol hydroxylase [Streptosporangium subroseum]